MDSTKPITHVSLCAGYGGIDLGLKRAVPNLRTVAFSEIEAFACANLVGKMEAGLLDLAPVWTDLKTFPWGQFHGLVDILSGGYPCQPFSAAGKRLGKDDPRHLWPFIADGIRAMRPQLCFFENVEGHISLGLREVIGELESIGYSATWGLFSAAEVGAPHQRKRVFILANDQYSGLEGLRELCSSISGQDSRLFVGNGRCREDVAHLSSSGLERHLGNVLGAGKAAGRAEGDERHIASGCVCRDVWPSRPGQPQHGWEPPRVVGNADSKRSQIWPRQGGQGLQGTDANDRKDADWKAEPPLGGDADGAAHRLDHAELYTSCDNRTDELRLLGNGVVPATAELAFRTLINRLIK